jgi:hypothetical protein
MMDHSDVVDDNDASLLSFLKLDGTIDIVAAVKRLDEDEELLPDDDFSILDCVERDGTFNLFKFVGRQEAPLLLEMSLLHEAGLINNNNTPTMEGNNRQIISWNKRCMLYQLWVGEHLVAATPFDSPWYLMYVKCPMLNVPKFHTQFRRRFRLPYAQFIQFVSGAKENNWFPRWSKWNSKSPLELLILGGLRYLGRGWTFDDLKESTMISAEVHQNYFHQFISVGSEILYPLYVSVPQTQEDINDHMHEFNLAGFSGCIGSTDATHVAIEKCSYRLRNNHLGGKQHLTTRTFNLTVNHRRLILSTSIGMPGQWNDKTVVLFDEFVRGQYEGLNIIALFLILALLIVTNNFLFFLCLGKLHSDIKFPLFEYDPAGNVITTEYTGSWLIVDNRYLKWLTTVSPFKVTALEKERRWSHWLESLRKDVECTFGIMKGRWGILKTGIWLQGVEVADKIWKTCCALHNWLLEVDGLDGEWDGHISMHDARDVLNHIPFALQRLHEGWDPRTYDASGLGPGDDRLDVEVEMRANVPATLIRNCRTVHCLSLNAFRSKLIDHFGIMFKRHQLVWPQRLTK